MFNRRVSPWQARARTGVSQHSLGQERGAELQGLPKRPLSPPQGAPSSFPSPRPTTYAGHKGLPGRNEPNKTRLSPCEPPFTYTDNPATNKALWGPNAGPGR